MMGMPTFALSFSTCVLFAATLFPFMVSAAEPPAGLLYVRPAKVELDIAPGESKEATLAIENTTNTPLLLTLGTEDVEGGRTEGSPGSFVLVSDRAGAYPLRDLIELPERTLTLLSGKEVKIPVTVHIPADISPGGRYGAVTVSFKPADQKKGATSVSPESRMAVLFFVRVLGDTTEEGELVSFGVQNNARYVPVPSATAPLLFQMAFENKGGVHVNPYGRMTLDPLIGDGHVVSVDPWAVLPKTTRTRELSVSEPLTPGFYQAHLELNRGYGDVVDERVVWFVVYPGTRGLFGLALGVLVFIFVLWRSLRISRNFVT